jgi:hypothetical protein
MTQIYLYTLLGILLWALLRMLASPARFYEYPYFMSAVFIVFIVPQTISLLSFPAGAHAAAIERVVLMTLLCVLACFVGYAVRPSQWIVQKAQVPINRDRLFEVGILFVACGYLFNYLIGQLTEAERGGGAWTGRVTIYAFFAGLIFPGFSICFSRALTHRSPNAWFCAILAGIPPLGSGVLGGRREPAVIFVLTILLTLYYQRRWVMPRAMIVLALVIAAVAIPATGQYRSMLQKGEFKKLTDIDYVGNFRQFVSHSSVLELRNAAMVIEATKRQGNFGLGRAYWDQLVFRFVPAQFFGKPFKDGLMFRSSDEWMRRELSAMRYKIFEGSTITGIGDSFREFGYFGALFFAVLAVIYKSLWKASLPRDAIMAQLLYIQTLTSGMRAVTHQTVDYPPGLLYNLIFLGLATLYARQRPTSVRRSAVPAAVANS